MKKLIFLLLLFASFKAEAQTPSSSRIRYLAEWFMCRDTASANAAGDTSTVIIQCSDSSLYMRFSRYAPWRKIATSTGGGFLLTADTAAMLSGYVRSQRFLDSLTARRALMNGAGVLSNGVQPNITQVGTLTNLTVTGTISAGTITGTIVNGYVPTTRTITTTAPLLGGGDLSANRTFSIDTGRATTQVATGGRLKQQVDSLANTILWRDSSLYLVPTLGNRLMKVGGITFSGDANLDIRGTAPIINSVSNNGSSGLRYLITGYTGNLFRIQAVGLWSTANTKFAVDSAGSTTIGNGVDPVTVKLTLNGASGQSREIKTQSGGLDRWNDITTSTAESGNAVGSDYTKRRYNNAGVLMGTPFAINRSTGLVTIHSLTVDSSAVNLVGIVNVGTIRSTSRYFGTSVNLNKDSVSISSTAAGVLAAIDTTTGNLIRLPVGTVPTLSALTVTGTATATTFSATTLTGTLSTAAQPNITSVGTLSNFTVTGTTTTGNLSVTSNATVGGSLTVTSNVTAASLSTVSGIVGTGGLTITTAGVSNTVEKGLNMYYPNNSGGSAAGNAVVFSAKNSAGTPTDLVRVSGREGSNTAGAESSSFKVDTKIAGAYTNNFSVAADGVVEVGRNPTQIDRRYELNIGMNSDSTSGIIVTNTSTGSAASVWTYLNDGTPGYGTSLYYFPRSNNNIPIVGLDSTVNSGGLFGESLLRNLMVWNHAKTPIRYVIGDTLIATMDRINGKGRFNFYDSLITGNLRTSGIVSAGTISSTGNATFATTSGNVGIGTTTPFYSLDVRGATVIGDGTLKNAMTYSGSTAQVGTISNHSVAILSNNTTAITINTSQALRFNAYGPGTVTLDASGNVTTTSDTTKKIPLKRGVDNAIKKIMGIDIWYYKWKKETEYDTINTYLSTTAQSVKKVIPEAVGFNKDGSLSVSDRAELAVVIAAMQEQQREIEKLKHSDRLKSAKIKALEKKLSIK